MYTVGEISDFTHLNSQECQVTNKQTITSEYSLFGCWVISCEYEFLLLFL